MLPDAGRQYEQDLLRDIERVRSVLSECRRALVRADDETLFLQDMCRIAVELAGYKLAWVGLVRHDEACSIEAVASASDQGGLFTGVRVSWGDNEFGSGPAGHAVRSGRSQVVQNLHGAHGFGSWRPRALGPQHQAAAVLPLRIGGETDQVIGVMCIIAGQSDAFGKLELDLLEDVARDLGFGIGTLRGRSAQRLAEAELRASEQRFRATFDRVYVGVAHVDPDGRYLLVNRRLEEMLGYDPGEMTGMSIRDMSHPDDRHATDEIRARMRSGAIDGFQFKKRYFKKDRSIIWVALTVSVMRASDGRPLYDISVIEDITGRERTEALRQLEHTITRQLAEAESASEALQAAMRAICESEAWDCARYFVPGNQPDVLHFSDGWAGNDPAIAAFLRDSEGFRYDTSVGILGVAWREGRPAWSADISTDPRVAQGAVALRHGMRGLFVFPVRADGRVVGVLVFSSRAVREPEQRSVDAMETIGTQIGQFLQRKRAEEAQRRFRVAMDTSADIITLVDPETMRYIDVNATACEPQGYTREQMLAMGPQDVSDLPKEEFARQFALTIASGESTRLLATHRRADGVKFPIEVVRRAVRSEGRWIIVSVLRDISERVEAEASLRRSEERFRKLAALSSDSFWETDAQHRFIHVVSGTRFGVVYEAKEHLGKARWDMPSVSPGVAGWEWLRETMDAHESFHEFEFARADTDGRIHYRMISGQPVFAEHGVFVGYIGVARDITSRKRDEAKMLELNTQLEARVAQRTADLERANRELEAFSYSVAHDLRAPLRAINSFSAIVLKENAGKLDAASADYLRRVQDGGLRMGELVDDLLDLARISRQEPHRIDLNLATIAGKVLATLTDANPGRKVEVAMSGSMPANCDPALMEIVLSNLVGNAWKFTGKAAAARIEIGAEDREGRRVYFVRDNGAGFEMQYSQKLFTPFQRLHGRDEFEGTGIGLSLVKRIIDKHHGDVWAEGEKGRGACFYFTLG